MRKSVLFFGVLVSCHRQSPPFEPQVVADATSAIAACYHWGGEVGDQSAERNREIKLGVERDCPAARDKATAAWKLFPGNGALAAHLLELIDVGYFTATAREKNDICETSVAAFTKGLSESKREDPLFKAVCPAQATRLYAR